MRNPWGPFQRRARVGVPADHFPKARGRFAAVDGRGRVTALVAEGEPTGTATLEPAGSPPPAGEPADRRTAWRSRVGELMDTGPATVEELREVLGLQDVADYEIEHVMADHSATSVTHTHEHSAMGSQGDDDEHTHEHTHDGDADHDHHGSGSASVAPSPPLSTTTVATPVKPHELAARIAELRERQAERPEVERTRVTLVADGGPGLELDLAVRWDEGAWDPLKRNPDGSVGGKGAFVPTDGPARPFAMVAAGADVPQLVADPGAAWHAVLCVEGLRTDEDPGRELAPGSCKFPDLPVSLRLQIHDEGGHFGAVTCGRIDAMERIDMEGYGAIGGTGVFGTDEHGQLAQLLVTEQTQRFISIDPRDVDMEIIEVQVASSGIYGMYDEDDCEPAIYDWWIRYTNCTIGAATIVATPALQQAVITLASVELPATPIAVANARTATVTADGGPLEPPAAWFEDPGFHVGDGRLVRQKDGKMACPLTITDDGRVFGHVCYWGQKHTAAKDRHGNPLTPPRGKANLAHYLTGPGVRCADGTVVTGVGQVTMGCGHPSTSLRAAAAKAHYDGGYGAVQVADVRAGQDDFGVWVAGAMRSDLTPEQVRKFSAMGLSGDWREIGGHGYDYLELVAVLAGVPSPGFPIERGLVASADVEDDAARAGVDGDGRIVSLVAAGRVHRAPAEERIAVLEHAVGTLMEERSAALRTAAAESLRQLVDL